MLAKASFLLLLNEMAVDLGFFLAKTEGERAGVVDDDDDDLVNDLKEVRPPLPPPSRSTLALAREGESWKKCEKKRKDR